VVEEGLRGVFDPEPRLALSTRLQLELGRGAESARETAEKLAAEFEGKSQTESEEFLREFFVTEPRFRARTAGTPEVVTETGDVPPPTVVDVEGGEARGAISEAFQGQTTGTDLGPFEDEIESGAEPGDAGAGGVGSNVLGGVETEGETGVAIERVRAEPEVRTATDSESEDFLDRLAETDRRRETAVGSGLSELAGPALDPSVEATESLGEAESLGLDAPEVELPRLDAELERESESELEREFEFETEGERKGERERERESERETIFENEFESELYGQPEDEDELLEFDTAGDEFVKEFEFGVLAPSSIATGDVFGDGSDGPLDDLL